MPLVGEQKEGEAENKSPPKRRAFMLYVLQSDCVVKAQKRYTAEGLADGSGSPDDRRATSEQRHISCTKILCPQPLIIKLIFFGNGTCPTTANGFYYTVSFVKNIAGTAGSYSHFFVNGNINIGSS